MHDTNDRHLKAMLSGSHVDGFCRGSTAALGLMMKYIEEARWWQFWKFALAKRMANDIQTMNASMHLEFMKEFGDDGSGSVQ